MGQMVVGCDGCQMMASSLSFPMELLVVEASMGLLEVAVVEQQTVGVVKCILAMAMEWAPHLPHHHRSPPSLNGEL
jgi:hypothetical protein